MATRTPSLVRDGALVVAGTLIWHLSNLAFNLVAARELGPGSYGDLAAVVTLLYLASPLFVSVQTVASRMTTGAWTHGDAAAIRAALRFHARRLWVAGLLLAAGVGMASGGLARFLRIASGRPLVILACAFPFYFLTHLQRGVLQGTLHLRRYSISSVCEALVKLLATVVVLLAVSRTVDAAVMAIVLSAVLAVVVNWVLLRFLPRARDRAEPVRDTSGYSLATLGCLILLAVLLSADIFAAKRYLAPHDAGLYASAALCGKIVFFATSCLTVVLFPVFSTRQEQGHDARHVLRKGLALVGATSAVLIVAYTVAPKAVVTPLFGERFAPAAAYLGLMAITFALYGLVYLAAMFLLSQKRSAGLAPLAIAVVAQLAGFFALHATIRELIAVNALVFASAAAVLLRMALGPEPASRPALQLS
jgi:O-antigen/teichoic acid export membrane protein